MSESEAEISDSQSVEPYIIRRGKRELDSEEAYSQVSDPTTDDLPSASEQAPKTPRKRKLSTAVKHSQSKVKRVRPDYRDEYRKLYNEEIENVINGPTNGEEVFETSQHGLSVWNASEKAAFFRSLDRRGRHDLRGIASDVGSKSEPEISRYIKLLQRSLAEECSKIRPPRLLQRPLEAAFELNSECTEALDRCADALSALQQRDEETNEIAKHGDMWLLTPSVGRWAEECMMVEGKKAELISSLPEAELLRLKSFLDLSKSFFMNSDDVEYNWRSYTERVQAPTIRKTAFTDFHTMTVSMTKKIIKSAIFVALYRIRATDSSLYEVKKKDVSTALSILGITLNVKDYWIGLARRCNLRVYNEVRRSNPNQKEYSYNEVEDILTLKHADYLTESCSRGRSGLEGGGLLDSGSDEIADSRSPSPIRTASKSASSQSSSSLSAPESHSGTNITMRSVSPTEISDSELLKIQKDSKLDDLDLEESAQEELRLYDLLDIKHPKINNAFENVDKDIGDGKIAEEPSHIFREPETQDDWTSWTGYRAEWDNPAGLVPQWKFSGNKEQRGRRRERQELTDEELNDMENGLENESWDSSLTSSAAEVESDTDSSRVGGQTQSEFEYREQVSSEEHNNIDVMETGDESMSPRSRSRFDVPREYSTGDEREKEEKEDDDDDDDESAVEEEQDDRLESAH